MPPDEPEVDLSQVVRLRIRGLRQARGWNLDALAARSRLSPSTLSRIETGQRSIGLDQLVPLARALGTTIDRLVESDRDEDVVIRPVSHEELGLTAWLLSREPAQPGGSMVAKMRITPRRRHGPGYLVVHPGTEWFTVLSGTALLHLGERKITVETGQAAEFATMTPHSLGAVGGPVEILTMFDADGERAHQRSVDPVRASLPRATNAAQRQRSTGARRSATSTATE
ncbi:MAG: helix-turn-helix domain-containing protein [Propionibacteriaceae bacterium]